MKRFYKDVTVSAELFVLLDGRPIKTPANVNLALPSRVLAEAIAQEWRDQGAEVVSASMHMTRLANTAFDHAETLRDEIVRELLAFGKSDLLSYRAVAPDELIVRQQTAWGPILDWVNETLGVRLKTTQGIVHVAQDAEAVAALDRALHEADRWTLTGLQTATSITGSLILALAMVRGRLSPREAFALSRVDETFQAEKWGSDAEAEARARLHLAELEMAGKFIDLARA